VIAKVIGIARIAPQAGWAIPTDEVHKPK